MTAMENPLKTWRGELTQDQAGELLGVDGMTYSRWERGVHLPRKSKWNIIREKTGIVPSELANHVKQPETAQ